MGLNKKVVVIVIVAVILIISTPFLIIGISKASEQKQEKEAMISAMECWSQGKEYNGECSSCWRYVEYDEIEDKAIEIVKRLKTDPMKLAYFLDKLEDKEYREQSIKNELSNVVLTFEEKLLIKDEFFIYYYSLPGVTRSEVDNYIKQNGTKTLIVKSGEGGFYDGKEDSSSRNTVGIKGSPLYNGHSTTYFGDFKCEHYYGVELNSYYEERNYSRKSYCYKDKVIQFDPRECECYYSGKYLFAFENSTIHIYDIEAEKSYEFEQ